MRIGSLLLLSLLLQANFVLSQSVTLSGQIKHPVDNKVYISKYSDVISYEEIIIDSALVNKEGHFSVTFPWNTSGPAMLNHGEEYTDLYICPGNNMYLTFDAEAFDETMKHSGDGAAVNNFLAWNMLEQENSTMDIFGKPKPEFLLYVDSVYTLRETRLDQMELESGEKSTCEKQFKSIQQAELTYLRYYELLEYPGLYGYLNRNNPSAPPVSNDFSFLQDVTISNPDALAAENYRAFLESYINHSTRLFYAQDTSLSYNATKEKVIRNSFEGPVLEYAYASMLYDYYTFFGDAETGDEYLTWFTHNFNSSQYLPMLHEARETALILSPGRPAPEFMATDKSGEQIALSAFKGKFVYLDIWATWCGPCVAEIPGMEKLISMFEGEDIVFLSVSIDDDRDRWETFITNKDMHGVQLYSEGGFDSGISKRYGVRGIPRYVLIDKAGIIIDGNAGRPGQIRDKLNELLTK
jgi:thiol-disulfide isomerase/thioredoxin